MKLRKGILIGLIIALAIIILSLSGTVNAALANKPMYLGLEQYRNSGYSYKAMEKIMWKITSYDDLDGTNPNKNKTLYCIKAGPGFSSTPNSNSDMGEFNPGDSIIKEYNQKFDLKNRDSITENYLNAICSGENYNSLIWVLEHCYVPENDTNGEYRNELLTAAGISGSKISNDEIDVTQQWAIWYFTNEDAYKLINRTFELAVKEKDDANYIDISDKFPNNREGEERNYDAIALFNYLVNGGIDNKSTIPTENITTNPIYITSTNIEIELKEENYILGPYKLNGPENIEDIELTATLKNGDIDVPFTIVNSDNTQTTLKDLVGESFYISVPKDSYTSGLKFTITTKIYQTALTYWSVANAPDGEQPIVEITKDEKNFDIEIITPNIPEEKLFDLALRKFITKVGSTSYDRIPDISDEQLSKLNNGTWTVEKRHTKDPIEVKTGDIVLYTIRIYNEGEVAGKATLITDHLPSGLEFIEDSQINKTNGWTNPSGDKKTIVTNKLAGEVINAFDGETLDYRDVQIECRVVATSKTNDQYLKNIAEITQHTDSEGNEIVDRDSFPGDLSKSQKENYNPGTSTIGWGYYDDDDYEELKLPGKYFDLALRKFITMVNKTDLVDENGKYIKEPVVDVTNLKAGTATTATYKHQKAPVGVAVGDEVIYTIRVYNEGELDGYVTKITDYLPPELDFVNDEFNAQYGWSANGRVITTDITSPNSTHSANRDIIYANREGGVLLKAYDGGENLNYIDVQIKCKVKEVENLDTIITNIAEITAYTDSNGEKIIDRDSTEDSLTKNNSKPADDIQNDNLPEDIALPDYKGNTSNKSILTDKEYHYKGQQDDDDFDKLILQEFDLALRKFITGVNDEKVTNRYPVFTTNKDANGNYIYTHTKEPVEVETTDLVEYTIRIFNEGNIAGYAKEIIDDIPNGLEFVPTEETNKEYRWVMYREVKEDEEIEPENIKVFNGKNYVLTENAKEAQIIATDYLSKEQEKEETGNLLDAFDREVMVTPDYKDVKAVFKVIAPNSYEGIITNTAEISDDSDESGNPIIDRDSTPNNNNEKEDDIDVEHIKLTYFDLALRKFITAVDEKEVTDRYPVFSISEEGKYIYTHTKEPVEVENGNIVTYTLRIYNEGTKAGYAKQVKDDLPEGLEFLPENETNKEYRWVMLDEEGNETENIEEAVSISTDYLSKDQEDETGRNNLLKAFNKEEMEEPDYRDIKIAFKVTEPNTSDRILINKAQIADDEDEKGNPVVDKDSTPDKWIEEDDDQDIEKVKVKYFDLALRKWVTEAIVIENGKEKVTPTGHKAEDDPEEVVKVEIEKSKINKVVVKFRYKIRVTNEGEIAGYALEVSDYIPEGLKFVPADNKDWKEVDGKIVTNALAETLLQPGESAEVEVLLTWINGNDNMGLKVNTAEISKDKNDSNTPDIDSTPNNQKPGEDDIDDAPVILATKTGELLNTSYILLGTISLVILSTGIVLIKKYVL